jgi:6-phosphofructokinase 1
VINESLVGVIEEASRHPEIENVYGAVHAVAGIVKEDFIDLKKLSADTLKAVAASPCAALGSSRDKPDKEYCERIFEVFKKRNIRYFFYIGGNDSASTANIINNMAAEVGYDLRAFHIPKTIDNDLLVTDHCPGYGSAAKFVACAVMGDDLDNRSLPGVKIDVIMGRHAGFLVAASVLAKQREDDGPHLVYVPERGVSLDQVLGDVERVYRKLGRCVIAKSEGIVDPDGVTWAEKLVKEPEFDAHGNIQLSGTGSLADFLAAKIRAELGVKRVRADTFGYQANGRRCGLWDRAVPDRAGQCGAEDQVNARGIHQCGR